MTTTAVVNDFHVLQQVSNRPLVRTASLSVHAIVLAG